MLQRNIDLTSISINAQQTQGLHSPVSGGDLPEYVGLSPLSAGESHGVSGMSPGSENRRAGTLVTSSTGHVRYVAFGTSHDSDLLHLFQEPIQPQSPSGFPFFPDMPGPQQTLLDILPPPRQCDELIAVFFEVFSPLFHILHDPTFHSEYRNFKTSPQSAPVAFLGLVFATLGLAVTALDHDHSLLTDLGREPTPALNIKALAAKYRSTAMKCLAADNFLWQHNLRTLQCLILLIYAINHAHGPAWSLLGTTLNIAIAIGCHVDPSSFEVGYVEAEERRRAWAALMMLHTIQNTCLGNQTPFKIENNVALPADLEDEEIALSSMTDDLSRSQTQGMPSKMSYILFKFRLYNLASDICRFVSRSPAQQLQTQLQVLDNRIFAEQKQQADRFQNISDLPLYHQAHSLILDNYTNHLVLLLHRPCSNMNDSHNYHERADASYTRCNQSALAIIANYENLYNRAEFRPYCWYIQGLGSFHAFLASSTLLVLLGKNGVPVRSRATALRAVQKCHVKFHEMAPYSEICNRACSILDPLVARDRPHSLPPTVEGDTSVVRILDSIGGSDQPSGMVDYFEDFDVNGWTVPEHFEHIVSSIPCEQWLSPAGFPWTGAVPS